MIDRAFGPYNPQRLEVQVKVSVKEVVKFVGKMLLRKEFWFLFVSSFTVFLMLTWRGQMRDYILREAWKSAHRRIV